MPKATKKIKIANDFAKDSEGFYTATITDFEESVADNSQWVEDESEIREIDGWKVLISCDGVSRPIDYQIYLNATISPQKYTKQDGSESYSRLTLFCMNLGVFSESEIIENPGKFEDFDLDTLIGKRFRFKFEPTSAGKKKVNLKSIEII